MWNIPMKFKCSAASKPCGKRCIPKKYNCKSDGKPSEDTISYERKEPLPTNFSAITSEVLKVLKDSNYLETWGVDKKKIGAEALKQIKDTEEILNSGVSWNEAGSNDKAVFYIKPESDLDRRRIKKLVSDPNSKYLFRGHTEYFEDADSGNIGLSIGEKT
jgi:hypothetical protein